MTIPASIRRMPAVSTNGVVTVFAFDFLVFTAADVRAVWRPSGGESVDLLLSIDYTVSLNPDQNASPGGTITTIGSSSPRPAGGTITLLGQQEYQQLTDVPNAGPFFGDTVEKAIDYQAVLIQQLSELLSRTLSVGPADGSITELPSTAARANRFLAFDALGAPIAATSVTGTPVTPFMVTVLDDANAAAARTTLGATATGDAVFTAASAAAARTAIGATIVNKNRFANGAFVFDQRNNGAAVSVTAAQVNCADCVVAAGMASPGVFTVQQMGSGGPPAGSGNYLRASVTTNDASMAVGDTYIIGTRIEGLDVADLLLGSPDARAFSVGFWFRSSITGTFSGSVINVAGTRSYLFQWTYSAANVWQYVRVDNIPGETTGAWPANNTHSMSIRFSLGAGTNFSSATVGSWLAADARKVTGTTDIIGTNGATYDIALLQVEAGTACTPFEWVPYQAGLARVQRYYWEIGRTGAIANPLVGFQVSTNIIDFLVACPVPMRSAPTINSSAWTFSSGASPVGNQIACYDFTAAGFLTSTHSSIVGSWVGSADRQHGFLRFTGSGGVFGGAGGRAVQLATGATAFINLSSEL